MTENLTNRRTDDDLDNGWHLDKRVPLSIIIALFAQTIYFTVFITRLDDRVAVLEKDNIETHRVIRDMAEIRIHQQYLRDEFDKLDKFLRDDVEWVTPKTRKGSK